MAGEIASGRRLLVLAFQPFGSLVLDVIGGVGLLGLQLFSPFEIRDPITALIVALSILVVLLAVAGYRLQRELDLRGFSRFTTEPLIDLTRSEFRVANDPRIWTAKATLMVSVHNDGPSARFAASIENVRPVADDIGTALDDYQVDEVAWEHTAERINEIPSAANARLKIATAASWLVGRDVGDAWFFHTAKSASYAPSGHGAGLRLQVPRAGTVHLRLTVINVDTNQSLVEDYTIEFWASAPRYFRKGLD